MKSLTLGTYNQESRALGVPVEGRLEMAAAAAAAMKSSLERQDPWTNRNTRSSVVGTPYWLTPEAIAGRLVGCLVALGFGGCGRK